MANPKRPRDPLQLAKLIGDIATGQIEEKTDDGKPTRRSVEFCFGKRSI
jgi:hypothetical protein